MKIVKLIQGSPAWHAHRATHWNASDAPAMLGVSPYKTRAELLREVATGQRPEPTPQQAAIFAEGHRVEALARPLAEKIIGADLYPVVGVSDVDPKLSASFDGITMDECATFEHKSLNDALRTALVSKDVTGAELPDAYRAQMEQQLMVSGASRCLFVASAWDKDGALLDELHCWYTSEPELRARIVAGWAQFAQDVHDYRPAEVNAEPVGAAPDQLPALRVEVEGRVLATNLDAFKTSAMAVLGAINRDLKTDDDFANAEATVKWCHGVEDRLAATKAGVLAQMSTVDEVYRALDDVSAETRRVRLELDRLVKAEKENRRNEIVTHYQDQVRAHYASINSTLGEFALEVPADAMRAIGAAIKGRKTLGSITDAADAACASLKIDASQRAERVRQNIAVLDQYKDHAHLFADRVQLCATKTPEDLRAVASVRVSDYRCREEAAREAERERIRAEERAKAERTERLRQQAINEAERQRQEQAAAMEPDANQAPAKLEPFERGGASYFVPADTRTVNLGDINVAIAPLSISAAGLGSLGFNPLPESKRAKLYHASDFGAMRDAIIRHVQGASILEKAA